MVTIHLSGFHCQSTYKICKWILQRTWRLFVFIFFGDDLLLFICYPFCCAIVFFIYFKWRYLNINISVVYYLTYIWQLELFKVTWPVPPWPLFYYFFFLLLLQIFIIIIISNVIVDHRYIYYCICIKCLKISKMTLNKISIW